MFGLADFIAALLAVPGNKISSKDAMSAFLNDRGSDDEHSIGGLGQDNDELFSKMEIRRKFTT